MGGFFMKEVKVLLKENELRPIA